MCLLWLSYKYVLTWEQILIERLPTRKLDLIKYQTVFASALSYLLSNIIPHENNFLLYTTVILLSQYKHVKGYKR